MASKTPAQYLDAVGAPLGCDSGEEDEEEEGTATASDVLYRLNNLFVSETVFSAATGKKHPRTATGLLKVMPSVMTGVSLFETLFAGSMYLLKAVKEKQIKKGGKLAPFVMAPEKQFTLVHVIDRRAVSYKVWFEYATVIYAAHLCQWPGEPTNFTVCLRSDD